MRWTSFFAARVSARATPYNGAPPGVPAVPQAFRGRVGRVRLAAVGVWGLAPMKRRELRSSPSQAPAATTFLVRIGSQGMDPTQLGAEWGSLSSTSERGPPPVRETRHYHRTVDPPADGHAYQPGMWPEIVYDRLPWFMCGAGFDPADP